MKLSNTMIQALAGMLSQSASELQAAAADQATACDVINKVSNRIAVAAGVDKDFRISEMIFDICESVTFDLWRCGKYDIQTISNGIKEYIGK